MQNEEHTNVQIDGYTRFCLTAITILLTLLIIGLWADAVRPVDQAGAGEAFLNSSAQRNTLIDASRQTNVKLDELMTLLKSGQVQVRIAGGEIPAPGSNNATNDTTK